MLDDTRDDTPADPQAEKVRLTPKKIDPTPICTVMSDRTLKIEPGSQTHVLQLHALLLSAAQGLMLSAVDRSMTAERVLVSISKGFDGLDPETETAIAKLLAA